MKFVYRIIAALTLLVIMALPVCAENGTNALDLTYEALENRFVVKGDAPAGSRVLLLVFGPEAGDSEYSDLYYMDSKSKVDGEFSFVVPMKKTAPIGEYDFCLTVNGQMVSSSSSYYSWNGYEDYGVKSFAFDSQMAASEKVSAVAVLEKDAKIPEVFMALYKGNKVVSVSTGVVLENEDETTITAEITLPENIEGCELKAFLIYKDSLAPLKNYLYQKN